MLQAILRVFYSQAKPVSEKTGHRWSWVTARWALGAELPGVGNRKPPI